MSERDSSKAESDSHGKPPVPGAIGALAAGAFPAAVFAIVNSMPGVIPAASLAALAATAFGGTALSLAATRGPSGAINDAGSEREEALSDALFRAHDEVEALRRELDALADLIVDCDSDGRIMFANDAFLSVYGDDSVGRGIADIRPVDEADRQDAAHYITRIGGPDSPQQVIAWLDSRVQAGPEDTCFTRCVGRDVTRFVEAAAALGAARDEAEQASRAKARFLAAMSHEVRTPLNGILGLANLLLDDELTPAQRNHIHAIRQSGQTLAALVDEVLDFSRIEAGHIDLAEEDTSPRDIVREVSELLGIRAHAKGLGLGAYTAPDVPRTVRLDGGRLRQILTNLVTNAVKFTEAGSVSVTCGWKNEGRSRTGELIIEVRDTGPGIAAEDQQRIFSEFEQTGAARADGSGLGLAIVQRIVAAMDGHIGLTSKPGAGSAFTVRLPCKVAKPAAKAEKPLSGIKIAIAMSPAGERGCLAKTCRSLGAKVTENAAEADIILAEPNDASPETVRGKAIALLSLTDRPDPETIRASGFGGYLTRPVRIESLVARIAALRSAGVPAKPASAPAGDRLPRARYGLKVLLAEDDPVSAMLMVATLQRMGHEVTHVSDGRTALERLTAQAKNFDTALLDIQLPGATGLDIARIMKGRSRRPVLIAVTANALAAGKADAIDAGFDAHVTKPVDPHRLAMVLDTVPARSSSAA
ncbi:MAG: response regulator [Rhodobiaceae bacterium]|nr:response regulator [Rhodobiaceae bacterium]MCC0049240.1 response regulator [Rhodobiaceae bacterium]